jgi:Glyoxalase-like domain
VPSKGIQVTFDANNVHALARWWADLVGYQIEDCHELVTKLLADGVITDSDIVEIEGRLFFADGAAASDPRRVGPRMYFQQVPESKTAKNRMHLDLPVPADELDNEVARLCSIGATLLAMKNDQGHPTAVMQDPEGNEFCLH